MVTAPAILWFCAIPVSPQIFGGGSESLYQWDGVRQENLGWYIAGAGDVNGDGFDDVIAGAPDAIIGGFSNVGSAYVFSGSDGSMIYQWNGIGRGTTFGWSVSGAGDVNGDGFDDVIVGAPALASSVFLGTAYVYSGATGALIFEWSGGSVQDEFARSVSGAGDVNGDGYDDLIVGAPENSPVGLSRSGSAFVYSGFDGALIHQWFGESGLDVFGFSVAEAGDMNGDGMDDLIVGARWADPLGIPFAGAVYLFSGLDGTTLYRWDGQGEGDSFGSSISVAGDVNGDGRTDFVFGAPTADPGGLTSAGSAYVFSGADFSLLYKWDGFYGDNFGNSVAGAGDVNGDRFSDIIVGAPKANPHGISLSGKANVYSGLDGSKILQINGQDYYDQFGFSVSGVGDVSGDGFDNVGVGAPNTYAGGIPYTGSVYVYGFNPFLHGSESSISAAAGGVLALDLDFPSSSGFHEYIVLLSGSGAGPSFYGIKIPLTRDSLVIDSFLGIYPVPNYADLHGTLDFYGDATASFAVPAGIPSSLIGNEYYFAAVAGPAGLLPELSSIAVVIEITP